MLEMLGAAGRYLALILLNYDSIQHLTGQPQRAGVY